MKKLLLAFGLLWATVASAQFVPGQLLTAAALNGQFALYAPLTGATYSGLVTIPSLTVTGTFTMPASTVLPNGVTATTQPFTENSTIVATDNFVKRTLLASQATIPIPTTGGTYNFASAGSGTQIVILTSGGTISSVLAIAIPGSGYQVGDCLVMVGGNGDAILRVTSLSGSGVSTASVVYGGTGYTTGAQLTGMSLPPGTRTGNITGVLASPLTIIIPSGTLLQGARFVGFDNNTTGAFTTTVKLSNGSGGSIGTGVILPQGTSNSTSVTLYTDGVNDVWLADTPAGIGALSSASPAITGGTINSTTIGATTPSTGAFTALSASGTVSGAGFGNYLASPPGIGGTVANAAVFTNLTSTLTLSASNLAASGTVSGTGFTNLFASPPTIGSGVASTGAFTTLSASSTVSGAGFSNYLLAPPPIGSTTPNQGRFTSVLATTGYTLTNLMSSTTAPSIASGFGTSPALQNINGTAAFILHIGTGGVATSGVLTMPAATAGWACDASDISSVNATIFITKETSQTSTSVTLANFTTTGVAGAWAASDFLVVKCTAF
jgi:hypothetical protein